MTRMFALKEISSKLIQDEKKKQDLDKQELVDIGLNQSKAES